MRLAEQRGEAHVGGEAARLIEERKARKRAEQQRQSLRSAQGERGQQPKH
jgi:UPF0176 protein